MATILPTWQYLGTRKYLVVPFWYASVECHANEWSQHGCFGSTTGMSHQNHGLTKLVWLLYRYDTRYMYLCLFFWQVPVFKEDSYKEKIIICHCSCAWSVHMSYSYVFFTNWPSRDKSSWRSYRRWKSPVAFSFYAWICEYSYIHLNSCHRYPKLLEWLRAVNIVIWHCVTA